ncbi:LysR family transcriptional regulator [Enterocloster bolteae]|uniref:LysR family transcriptional regulator n=1 Tax=Enterocloster bolteae TaxID=208479 RepID=UPI0034A272AF
MDLENIEVFLEIARTRSISGAAKNLFISQSAVSYRLKMLEDELDCKLIERGRGQNQSRLTKEGEAFLPLAERLKDVRCDIKSFKEISCHPSITVGCVESMGIYLLDEFYNSMVKRNNKVKMYFVLSTDEKLYEMAQHGTIDVGYVVAPQQNKNVSTRRFFKERMILAASSDMEFAGTTVRPGQLDIRDTCQFDWKEQGIRLWYEHWFNPKELPYIKTNSPPLAFSFMKNHDCWGIVPHSMGIRLMEDAQMRLYELENPPLERMCYRIAPKGYGCLYPEAIEIWNREIEEFIQSKQWLTVCKESGELYD